MRIDRLTQGRDEPTITGMHVAKTNITEEKRDRGTGAPRGPRHVE
jgi:hypothetical protein